MNPFYHKLSKLTVFVGYLRSAIKFPDMERAKYLKNDMEYIRKAGVVPSSSGRDIPFMKSKEMEKLCDVINDVWYNLDVKSNFFFSTFKKFSFQLISAVCIQHKVGHFCYSL